MATITKVQLSGSTNGRNVLVAATATPGTTVHTAHATNIDEVWLWATNSSASDVKLTIEFGGTTAPNDLVEVTIPAEDGPYLVIPGFTATGSVVISAFAATGSVVTVNGYVNRIAP